MRMKRVNSWAVTWKRSGKRSRRHWPSAAAHLHRSHIHSWWRTRREQA